MRLLTIIPHYAKDARGQRLLARCLQELSRHEPMLLRHTLVIDDASPDEGTRTQLEELHGRYGIHFKLKVENRGFTDSVNIGLKYAKELGYDVALLMNNDIEIIQPFYRRARQIYKVDEKIGVWGGTLLYPTGRIQSAGISFLKNGFLVEHEKNHLFSRAQHASQAKFVSGITGAFQFIRLSILEKTGLYSLDFPLSYEDVEFCFRVWREGFKIYHDPTLYEIHAESETRGYMPGPLELVSEKKIVEMWESEREEIDAICDKVDAANAFLRKLLDDSANQSNPS